jgi:hypothetical protein
MLDGWRQHDLWAEVQTFFLFIGYPRSGHTLMEALWDAHAQMVVSHELDVLQYVFARFSREQIYAWSCPCRSRLGCYNVFGRQYTPRRASNPALLDRLVHRGVLAAELAEQHGDELPPAREPAGMPLRVRPFDQRLELRPGKRLEQLTEHAAECTHR